MKNLVQEALSQDFFKKEVEALQKGFSTDEITFAFNEGEFIDGKLFFDILVIIKGFPKKGCTISVSEEDKKLKEEGWFNV